jgi:hypothetical protein
MGRCTFAPDMELEGGGMKGRRLKEDDGEGHGPKTRQGATEKEEAFRSTFYCILKNRMLRG